MNYIRSSKTLFYGLQIAVGVVLVCHDEVSETGPSYSAARKEHLYREDTGASSDFHYFKIPYMQSYATIHVYRIQKSVRYMYMV